MESLRWKSLFGFQIQPPILQYTVSNTVSQYRKGGGGGIQGNILLLMFCCILCKK